MPGLTGLVAHPNPKDEDEIVLIFDDGIARERVTVSVFELAETIARLEEPGSMLMRADELEEADDDAERIRQEFMQVQPWQTRPPRIASESMGEYVVLPVSLIQPPGLMFMRRVMLNGPDTLEFETPSGSLYELEYQSVLKYLRPMLPS